MMIESGNLRIWRLTNECSRIFIELLLVTYFTLLSTQQNLQAKVSKLEAENERQSKMKFIAVAAKLAFQESIKGIETDYKVLVQERRELQAANDALTAEMGEMEGYIGQLQTIIEQAEAKADEAVMETAKLKAQCAAQDMLIQKLNAEASDGVKGESGTAVGTPAGKLKSLEDAVARKDIEIELLQEKLAMLQSHVDDSDGDG